MEENEKALIMQRNVKLNKLIERRFKDLKKTNEELVVQNNSLMEKIAILERDLTTWHRISNTKKVIDMAKVASVLDYLFLGRTTLFRFLRDMKVLKRGNLPYRKYLKRGYFKVREKIIFKGDEYESYLQTYTSMKGLDFIRRLIDEYFR